MEVSLTRYASLSLALAASVSLAACKGERYNPSVSESAGGAVAPAVTDTTGGGGAAGMSDTTGAMSADTTGMAGGEASGGLSDLSDANYAALVDEANEADSVAGALAADKATDPNVKAFAKRMIADHHALRVQDQQLVKQLNLTPQPPANDPVQQLASQEKSALQSAQKGAAFDSTYIDHEVKVHQAVMGLLDAIKNNAENDQLKALAEKAEPIIQNHLERAQTLQKRLTSAS